MSNDQRRRNRRQRTRRRGGRRGYEPVGPVQFTGIMGFFQRNVRVFFLGGILVMVLSLGGIIFSSQLGNSTPRNDDEIVEEEPTAEPTEEATTEPEDEVVRFYDAPPPMAIDPEGSYDAIIKLESGEVRLHLLPDEAPSYVNNFVFLAQNDFYDGLGFHRVVPGFVAQAGDPSASGSGDAGYSLEEEHNDLPFDAGVVSMAKAGPRVSSSQFFITLDPAPHLNGDFTVFGRVTEGLDLLRELQARDPSASDASDPVRILDIEIVEASAG